MKQKRKTLYLWDLANTLFPEEWDKEKTGFANYDEYVKSLSYDLEKISPLEYERCYEKPYKEGLFRLKIATGFRKVLSWTKNNEAFTTGVKEQIDWRAEYLLKKYSFDIRKYLKKIHSTFDFAPTNKKTREMIISLVKKKLQEGFNEIVYTDDKLENCLFFLEAVRKTKERVGNFQLRIYNIKNDDRGIRNKGTYWEAGNLYDIMSNEKKERKS